MKILITVSGAWGTGSFIVAHSLMKNLIKLNHQVKLFFPDNPEIPSADKEYYFNSHNLFEVWKFPIHSNGTILENFPLIIKDPHPRSPKGKLYSKLTQEEFDMFFNLLEKRLKEVINNFKPDIIECQHIWSLSYVIKKLGCPYICNAHHIDQIGYVQDKRMQPLALQSAQEAKYIFAISDFVKKEIEHLYDIDNNKIKVIPSSYDNTIFKKMQVDKKQILEKHNLDIPDNATIFCFVGKISKTKGIDILLKANRPICKDENVHFLIIGTGNLNTLLTQKEIEECDCKNVHFLDHQSPENIAELYNISKFGIFPSRSEGFGIACLEAMGCALPVIATSSGGMKEFAVGKIIPPEDSNTLSNSILEMKNLNKEKYRALSKKAENKAREYTWEKITQQHLDYYLKIYNKKNGNI